MNSNFQTKLIPDFKLDEKLIYRVQKLDTFDFKKESSPPFSRDYLIELKLVDDNRFEAYFPETLLSVSKYFNDITPYISQLATAQTKCLYYAIDHSFQGIELMNINELTNSLIKLKSDWLGIDGIKSSNDEVSEELDYLIQNPDSLEKFFLEDIIDIHELYGGEFIDDIYYDLLPAQSSIKKAINGLFGMFNKPIGSVNILGNNVNRAGELVIDHVWGQDTVSSATRHDFETIQRDIEDGIFNLEDYQDITLHHRRFVYDREDFILSRYEYGMIIDTPAMNKKKSTLIRLVD